MSRSTPSGSILAEKTNKMNQNPRGELSSGLGARCKPGHNSDFR